MKNFTKFFALFAALLVVIGLAACDTVTTTKNAATEATTATDATTAATDSTAHTHVYDQQVATADYKASAATCTAPAKYYYSCECGEKGTETFDYGTALGHTWDDGVVTTEASCETAGVKTYTCSSCQETKTEEIAALGHAYEEFTKGWMDASGAVAAYHCPTCDKYFDASKTEIEIYVPAEEYTYALSVEKGKLILTKAPTAACAAYYDAESWSCVIAEYSLEEAASNSMNLENKAYSGLCAVSGTVASITNDTYGNSYIYVVTDEGNLVVLMIYGASSFKAVEADGALTITCGQTFTLGTDGTMTVAKGSSQKTFSTDGEDGGALYKPGDQVTLIGELQNYNGTMELCNAVLVNKTAGELTTNAYLNTVADENVASVTYKDVTGATIDAKDAKIGDVLVAEITVKDGYEIAEVTAKSAVGTKLTVSDTYSFTCEFGTTVTVKSQEKGVIITEPTIVTSPVEGVAYKYGTYHGGVNSWEFATGALSGSYLVNASYYDGGVDMYVEAVVTTTESATKSYYIYFMDGETKKYLSVKNNTTYFAPEFVTEGQVAWSYDATNKVWVTAFVGTDSTTYVVGQVNGTHTTAGMSVISKLATSGYYGLSLYEFVNRPAIEKASLKAESAELYVGETAQIDLVIEPVDAGKIGWKYVVESTEQTAASVTCDENGLVTATNAGKATITVTNGTISLTFTVTVSEKPTLNNVTLKAEKADIYVGKTAQIEYVYDPVDAEKLEWTYLGYDETIVSVDENGLVTALKEGTTTVTACGGEYKLLFTVTATVKPVPTSPVTITYSDTTTTTNMTGNNDASLLGVDADFFTIVGIKNNGSVNIGLNKAGQMRLYQDSTSGNGSTLSVSVKDGYVITKVTVTYGSKVAAVSVNGGDSETPTASTSVDYTMNGSTFTVQNVGGGQVYVMSLVVTFEAAKAECAHEYGEETTSYAHIAEGYLEVSKTCSKCNEVSTEKVALSNYDCVKNCTGNGQGGTTYAFDGTTVTVNSMTTKVNQWGRFNFTAVTVSYKYAYIVVKGATKGLCLGLKVDGDNNPYDGTSGNKVYKGVNEDEIIVVWDLETLGIDATKLNKVVFWAYSNDEAVTSGSFSVVAAGLANVATASTGSAE